MANEQTQGFSLRFIIVTLNEFQVLLVVVLSILSSHQSVNHLGLQTNPLSAYINIDTHKHTIERAHRNTDTPKRTPTENQIS